VIIDDTLSMLDHSRGGPRNEQQTAYETGIEQIKEIARNAAKAPTTQNMRVFLLSELDRSPVYDSRIGDRSVHDIEETFAGRRKPTLRHVAPLLALQKGRAFLTDQSGDTGQKALH